MIDYQILLKFVKLILSENTIELNNYLYILLLTLNSHNYYTSILSNCTFDENILLNKFNNYVNILLIYLIHFATYLSFKYNSFKFKQIVIKYK